MSAHVWPWLFLLIFGGILSLCVTANGVKGRGGNGETVHIRTRRQLAAANNTVELLVVADREALSKYLDRNNNNTVAALNELLRYVAGLVREVNERFATLGSAGITLSVNLVDLIVFSTSAESSATENNIVSGNVINADLSLLNFAIQIPAVAANTSFLYAVLLTGYNVTRGDGTDADVRTFFGGMCSVAIGARAGIVENFCVERTALSITKGIALAMGAFTDGVSNNCTDQFFVQSFAFNLPPREFRGNPFAFSNCSAEEIRTFLMNDASSSCLRTQSVPNPLDVGTLAAAELGQSFNADTQCELRFGNGSTFCRSLYGISPNFTFVDDLCRDMRCSVNGSACDGTLPFDGTSCGIQQWCQDGYCVSDPAAPVTVSNTCPQGDQPDATCLLSLCPIAGALYRDFICCLTCSTLVSTTEGTTATLSIVQTETTPTGTPTLSIVGPTTLPTQATPAETTGITTLETTMGATTGATTVGTTMGATTEGTTLQTTMGATTGGTTLQTTGATTGGTTLQTTGATTGGTTLQTTGATTGGTTLQTTGGTTGGTTLQTTGGTTPPSAGPQTLSIIATSESTSSTGMASTEGSTTPSVNTQTLSVVTPGITGPTPPTPTLSIVTPATEITGPTTPTPTLSIITPATEVTGPTTPTPTLSIITPATEITGPTTPAPTLSIITPATENTGPTTPTATLSIVSPATETTATISTVGSTETTATISTVGSTETLSTIGSTETTATLSIVDETTATISTVGSTETPSTIESTETTATVESTETTATLSIVDETTVADMTSDTTLSIAPTTTTQASGPGGIVGSSG